MAAISRAFNQLLGLLLTGDISYDRDIAEIAAISINSSISGAQDFPLRGRELDFLVTHSIPCPESFNEIGPLLRSNPKATSRMECRQSASWRPVISQGPH